MFKEGAKNRRKVQKLNKETPKKVFKRQKEMTSNSSKKRNGNESYKGKK